MQVQVPQTTCWLSGAQKNEQFHRKRIDKLSDICEDGAMFHTNKLQVQRNHPRIVMHIPELLSVWRGNTDQKLIESLDQLLNCILKYTLKPEAGSVTFRNIIKALTENEDNNSPVRRIFQKALIKTV